MRSTVVLARVPLLPYFVSRVVRDKGLDEVLLHQAFQLRPRRCHSKSLLQLSHGVLKVVRHTTASFPFSLLFDSHVGGDRYYRIALFVPFLVGHWTASHGCCLQATKTTACLEGGVPRFIASATPSANIPQLPLRPPRVTG